MTYQDEIDALKNLPVFEMVSIITVDGDWFCLKLKDNTEVKLFQVVESLTRYEFEELAHKVIKKLPTVIAVDFEVNNKEK